MILYITKDDLKGEYLTISYLRDCLGKNRPDKIVMDSAVYKEFVDITNDSACFYAVPVEEMKDKIFINSKDFEGLEDLQMYSHIYTPTDTKASELIRHLVSGIILEGNEEFSKDEVINMLKQINDELS